MRSNLDKALSYIFVSEGGFAIRDTEPGGAVNMGVSMQTFALWSAPKQVSIADLKAMSVATAEAIYERRYANAIRFDDLPSGLDYCVLDAAVNEGVVAAAIFLALALDVAPYPGAPRDYATCMENAIKIHVASLLGFLVSQVAEIDLPATIDWMCDHRLIEKRKRPQWPQFGPGWTNRIEYVRGNALKMAEPTV